MARAETSILDETGLSRNTGACKPLSIIERPVLKPGRQLPLVKFRKKIPGRLALPPVLAGDGAKRLPPVLDVAGQDLAQAISEGSREQGKHAHAFFTPVKTSLGAGLRLFTFKTRAGTRTNSAIDLIASCAGR